MEQGMVRAWRGAELTLPDDAALRVSAEEALHSHHHKVAQLKDKLAVAERAAALAAAEVSVTLHIWIRREVGSIRTSACVGSGLRLGLIPGVQPLPWGQD